MLASRTSLLVLASLCAPSLAQIAVQSVSPGRHVIDAPTTVAVAITFAEALQPATVTASSFRVFGRWSGVTNGTLALSNGNRTVTLTPARPFFPGETVTVMLSRAIMSVSNLPLTAGYTWSFWTKAARGTRSLALSSTVPVRRSGEGGIRVYGAYAGDLDRDGAPDLTLPCEDSNDVRVMRNDGCGVFSAPVINPLLPNYRPSTNEGQDFNHDGVIDLALGNITSGQLSILLGNGSGGYLPAVHYPAAGGTRGLCVLDVEGDGDVDVVVANRSASNLAMFRNNGNGTFAPAVLFDGGGNGETAIGAADANGDGIADLFVGCYSSSTITLLLGTGTGTFTLASTAAVVGNPWMIALGDIDRDGAVDAVVCSSNQPRVAVSRGTGAGALLPAVDYIVGSFPLAIDLGDVDGDGALDFVASNFGSNSFSLYWNNGNGTFGAPMTLPAPQAGSCALVVDHDRDGDLDVIGIDELADVLLFFRQGSTWPAGVQTAACASALRLDEYARGAGYGTTPAHATRAGATLFVGITGGVTRAFGVLGGIARAPGLPVAFGTFNLDPAVLVVLPGGVTDAFGEAMLALPIPVGVAPDSMLALQAGVVDPAHAAGVALTNPEVAIVR
jgi:hypothetical protein